MGISDIKTRLRDVAGIESLTMLMQAGQQIYTLNGRQIVTDAAASDVQVESAIRAALASQASKALDQHLQASISQLVPAAPAATASPNNTVQSEGPAATPIGGNAAPAQTSAPVATATAAHPVSGAHTVKELLEEHKAMMAQIQASSVELLRATLQNQRDTIAGTIGNVAAKIKSQTDDYLSIMGQISNLEV